jgi:acyl-coenzyme A thioesterase PaaI-like protein
VASKGVRSISHFLDLFAFLNQLPFGAAVFSGIVCFYTPYTASITAQVGELTATTCECVMWEQPWLRNPFASVHALALANLGEFASGLLMVSTLQTKKGIVGIPVRIDTEYYKKARGRITGRCVIEDLDAALKAAQQQQQQQKSKGGDKDKEDSAAAPAEVVVVAELRDAKNELVAKTKVTWSLKNRPDRSKKAN